MCPQLYATFKVWSHSKYLFIYRIQVQGFNCSLRRMYFKTWKLFYVIQLPHRNVDLVERKQSNPRLLTLYCKDFQTINLLFPSADDCGQVAVSIENLSNIGSYKYKKAFEKNHCLRKFLLIVLELVWARVWVCFGWPQTHYSFAQAVLEYCILQS